jgi:cytoskeletal protein CcmA (bactofilin family)
MTRAITLRRVRCYHCRADFDVGSRAMTVSCPSCYRRVEVTDVDVRGMRFGGAVETCGRIAVAGRSRLSAKSLRSSLSVEIEGDVDTRLVAGPAVRLGAQASLKGDCEAEVLRVDEGARIAGGFFRVGRPERPGPGESPSTPKTPATR